MEIGKKTVASEMVATPGVTRAGIAVASGVADAVAVAVVVVVAVAVCFVAGMTAKELKTEAELRK